VLLRTGVPNGRLIAGALNLSWAHLRITSRWWNVLNIGIALFRY
jgi:hypothetical protein